MADARNLPEAPALGPQWLTESVWRAALLPLAAVNLASAAWAGADHASFADAIAPFGPVNGHLIDDYAASAACFGAALAVAAFHSPWRTPLLALSALWTSLHALSHIVGASNADPAWVGAAEAVLLSAVAVILIALTWMAARE